MNTGDILQGRYRIVRLVGQGGFGAVYRAWDTNLKVPVAVKENNDTVADAQRQFEREAHLLANLTHPNLPRVTNHFIIPGQGQYLVMDYIEGKSLAALLAERGGPLSEAEVLPWVRQIASALEYLHSRTPPIIHRDVKPQNIIVAADGRAVLVDFGISKVFDAVHGTTTGARAVTPGYSPPEQYGTAKTDARSDIYALGATLYALLTGQEPPESVNLIGGGLLPAPRVLNRAVSPAVEAAILAAMNPDMSQRLPSAAGFVAAFDAPPLFRSAGTAAARTTYQPTASPAAPPRPSRPSWLWLVGGLMIALLAAAAVLVLRPPINPRATATPDGTVVAIAEGGEITAVPTTTANSTPAATLAAPTITTAPETTTAPATLPMAAPPGDVPLTEQLLIPAGPFLMGSNEGDGAVAETTVTLNAFLIDRTEVTAAQYAAFLNVYGNQNEGGVPWIDMADDENVLTQTGVGFQPLPGLETQPVIQVSWYGAAAYCTAVGRRLPTDAEWEKAARGTDGRRFPWGDTPIDCSLANFWNGNANGCVGLQVAVGSYPSGASPYGLLDMAGNVWEWAGDWFDSNQNTRVLRGGSYLDKGAWATTFHRHRGAPENQYAHTGFRCAAEPPPQAKGAPPSLSRGQTRTLMLPADVHVEQVAVPAGAFAMGHMGDETAQPVHAVSLDSFWLDRTEVTNAQFAVFADDTGYQTAAERRGWGQGHRNGNWGRIDGANWQHPQGPSGDLTGMEQYPVVQVTWEDADAFCRWRGGRLPTEAEWEYAARGPDGPTFPWGNSFDSALLNYCDSNCPNSWADSRVDDGYAFSAPVGSYPGGAGWVGALDMAGNVYEWVYDYYDGDYYGRSPDHNPTGSATSTQRVQRGASWRDYDDVIYAARRFADPPDVADTNTGFRCAATPG